jgi:von Hippel-Lindau disease tumor supressor
MLILRARPVFSLLCLLLLLAWAPPVQAQQKHAAEVKGVKSINSDVETSIKFVNYSGKTLKVYWLDYDGKRDFKHLLKDGDSGEQTTYLTHPMLITDANDNALYVYFPDAQPRTVEIGVRKSP